MLSPDPDRSPLVAELDPRDLSALERTLSTWVRSGMAVTASGFLVARFGFYLQELARAGGVPIRHGEAALPAGMALLLAGPVIIVTAAIRHRFLLRATRAGTVARPVPLPGAWLIPALTALSVVVGGALAVYLLALWPR